MTRPRHVSSLTHMPISYRIPNPSSGGENGLKFIIPPPPLILCGDWNLAMETGVHVHIDHDIAIAPQQYLVLAQ